MGERIALILIVCCGMAMPLCADEVPAARAYFKSLLLGLDQIEAELDTLAQQADRDAAALIEGATFAIRGDQGLNVELSMRAGAMQHYFGSATGDVVLDVSGGDWPNDPALRAARAWVYQVELFAACTRRNKVLVMQQSFELDTRQRRFTRYGSQRFHHDLWLEPIAPRKLAQQYLDGLRHVLRDVGSASWTPLAQACWQASDTLRAGGKVHVVTGRSLTAYHVPETFTPWVGQAQRHDMILAVGDHEQAGSGDWGDIDAMRQAGRNFRGRRIVWIINRYNTHHHDLRRGERLIDLWAPVGDGAVKVDHYDTRLGPTTGVVALAVVQAIAAHCDAVTSSP